MPEDKVLRGYLIEFNNLNKNISRLESKIASQIQFVRHSCDLPQCEQCNEIRFPGDN